MRKNKKRLCPNSNSFLCIVSVLRNSYREGTNANCNRGKKLMHYADHKKCLPIAYSSSYSTTCCACLQVAGTATARRRHGSQSHLISAIVACT